VVTPWLRKSGKDSAGHKNENYEAVQKKQGTSYARRDDLKRGTKVQAAIRADLRMMAGERSWSCFLVAQNKNLQ